MQNLPLWLWRKCNWETVLHTRGNMVRSNIFDGWGNFQWNSRSVLTTYKQITFLTREHRPALLCIFFFLQFLSIFLFLVIFDHNDHFSILTILRILNTLIFDFCFEFSLLIFEHFDYWPSWPTEPFFLGSRLKISILLTYSALKGSLWSRTQLQSQ